MEAELIDSVAAAGLRGPTAGNSWALDLLVLDTEDAVQAYWDTTLPAANRPTFPWPGLLRAPVIVLPIVDVGAYVARYAEPDKAATGLGASSDAWPVPYWWVDAGAAVMAMLLAATDAGLGSLLFGLFDHEAAVREKFGVPADRRVVGALALGWPDDGRQGSRSARRGRPAPGEIVHRGSW